MDTIKIILAIICVILFAVSSTLLKQKKKGKLSWHIENPYEKTIKEDMENRIQNYNMELKEQEMQKKSATLLNGKPINE